MPSQFPQVVALDLELLGALLLDVLIHASNEDDAVSWKDDSLGDILRQSRIPQTRIQHHSDTPAILSGRIGDLERHIEDCSRAQMRGYNGIRLEFGLDSEMIAG